MIMVSSNSIFPEIRSDDVLQTRFFSHAQKEALKEKTMFEWFLESDKPFEEYNYPCVLAILAEGIKEENKEWVDYIKKNQHRYIIELHGFNHIKYGRLTKDELYMDLSSAKKVVEDTFGVKVSTWYVPFGRKGRNQYAEEVCKELGLKLGIPERKVDAKFWFKDRTLLQVNFHFWRKDQVDYVKRIICQQSTK